MSEFLMMAGGALLGGLAVFLLWKGGEAAVICGAWNEGYERGIKQGQAEERELATAPIRIEAVPR